MGGKTMSWLFKIIGKVAKVDMTDVMVQQTGDDIVSLIKELIL
jgi:hypothetical protein